MMKDNVCVLQVHGKKAVVNFRLYPDDVVREPKIKGVSSTSAETSAPSLGELPSLSWPPSQMFIAAEEMAHPVDYDAAVEDTIVDRVSRELCAWFCLCCSDVTRLRVGVQMSGKALWSCQGWLEGVRQRAACVQSG